MIYVVWASVGDKKRCGPEFVEADKSEKAAREGVNTLAGFVARCEAELTEGPENFRWSHGDLRGEATAIPLLQLNDHVLRDVLSDLEREFVRLCRMEEEGDFF